jgi:hypothetical protein
MSKLKHTPGPWKIIEGWNSKGEGKFFPSVILHGDLKQHNESLGRNSLCINVSHDQEIESIMANAKLISAAPSMIEALLKCRETLIMTSLIDKSSVTKKTLKIVEDAISKAT